MTRRQCMPWRTFVLLHLLSVHADIGCTARLLSAYEQAYGPWSIQLSKNMFHRGRWQLETRDEGAAAGVRRKRGRRRGGSDDLQLFFPEVPRPQPIESDGEGDVSIASGGMDQSETRSTQQEHIKTTTKHVRSVACILNLQKNGRFVLSLEEDECKQTGTLDNQNIIHQPLKGEWFLTPNPYCVTDRHYDTLLLVSEPRLRRRANGVETATVELRCKLWGRYGSEAVRAKLGFHHGRIRGRMTHGTVLVVKERFEEGGAGRRTVPTREVVGTFRGRTIVDCDSVVAPAKQINADRSVSVDEIDDDGDLLGVGDNFDEFGVLQPIADD